MKKYSKRFSKSYVLTVVLLFLAISLSALDLPDAENQLIELRAQISDLNAEFDLEWQSALSSDTLKEQSPFESDLKFLQRYLAGSSKLQHSQYQQRVILDAQLTDLLGWNFQTRNLQLILDTAAYNANDSFWQIKIKHQDWTSEELDFQLAISPEQAEKLYINKADIQVFGDVVFDMWTEPQLSRIYISSQAAALDTTLDIGTLSEYKLPNAVTALSFSPDNNQLLVGCKDKAFHIFDVASGEEDQPLRLYSDITCLRKLPFHNQVILALNDGYLRIFDLETQKEIWQIRHFGSIDDFALNADGRFACTASVDNRLRIYDLKTQKQMLEMEYAYGITTCDISPQGDYLAYGTEHGLKELFEYAVVRLFAIGETTSTLEFASNGIVEQVRFSPNGNLLLYSDTEGTSVIADIAAQAKKISIDNARKAQWLRGSDLITAIGSPQELNIINAETGDIINTITHKEAITCYTITSCGNYVAIGSEQGVFIYKL
jgi:WD40 repeat protein